MIIPPHPTTSPSSSSSGFTTALRKASPALATLQGIPRKNYLLQVNFELNNEMESVILPVIIVGAAS